MNVGDGGFPRLNPLNDFVRHHRMQQVVHPGASVFQGQVGQELPPRRQLPPGGAEDADDHGRAQAHGVGQRHVGGGVVKPGREPEKAEDRQGAGQDQIGHAQGKHRRPAEIDQQQTHGAVSEAEIQPGADQVEPGQNDGQGQADNQLQPRPRPGNEQRPRRRENQRR
jgi:hypothetical protein